MTIPVTGITPNYGIEYIVPGEPARNTRAKLERNAKTIDAALTRGGVAPPNAQDLVALAGRVATLEAALTANTPGAWQTLTVTNGTNWGAPFPTAAVRRLSKTLVQVRGLIRSPLSHTAMLTLPAGFLPDTTEAMPAMTGAGTVCQLEVDAATGKVTPIGPTSGAAIGYVSIARIFTSVQP